MLTQNNWLKLSLVLLIALFTKVVLAEGRTGSRATASRSTETVRAPRHETARIDTGVGLAIIGGGVGIGVNVSPMFRLTRDVPVYLGMDTGVKFFSVGGGYRYSSTGVTLIPLMVSSYYRFVIPGNANFSPYAGLSFGPAIGIVSNSGFGWSGMTFGFYPKGGASWTVARGVAINAELRFGVLGSFYFEPCGAVSFAL